jgi:hypothetical protein
VSRFFWRQNLAAVEKHVSRSRLRGLLGSFSVFAQPNLAIGERGKNLKMKKKSGDVLEPII